MLPEAQRTSAPSAVSVSIRTAVWIVMCNEPVTRTPLSGLDGPNFLRTAIRPGISCSATEISFRPHSAREMSLTWKSTLAMACIRFWAIVRSSLFNGRFERGDLVGLFPRQVGFAEMAVVCRLAVNWTEQVELLDD